MFKQMKKLILLSAILLAPVYQVQADLIIAPMRLVFEDRVRTESIVLINSGNETKTYRMQWQEKTALPEGGYRNLTPEEIKDFPIASTMLRMSPKQVTLAPKERQVIKLSLRKPRDLPDGEYRSHILFQDLPIGNSKDESKAGLQIKLVMSFTMPVIVRQGKLNQSTKIDNIELANVDDKTKLKVMLSHSGTQSTVGQIIAYFTPNKGGNKKEVARLNGFNFYHELTNVIAKPSWFGDKVTPGKLEIVYLGSKEMKDEIIAKRVFDITKDMLN